MAKLKTYFLLEKLTHFSALSDIVQVAVPPNGAQHDGVLYYGNQSSDLNLACVCVCVCLRPRLSGAWVDGVWWGVGGGSVGTEWLWVIE